MRKLKGGREVLKRSRRLDEPRSHRPVTCRCVLVQPEVAIDSLTEEILLGPPTLPSRLP